MLFIHLHSLVRFLNLFYRFHPCSISLFVNLFERITLRRKEAPFLIFLCTRTIFTGLKNLFWRRTFYHFKPGSTWFLDHLWLWVRLFDKDRVWVSLSRIFLSMLSVKLRWNWFLDMNIINYLVALLWGLGRKLFSYWSSFKLILSLRILSLMIFLFSWFIILLVNHLIITFSCWKLVSIRFFNILVFAYFNLTVIFIVHRSFALVKVILTIGKLIGWVALLINKLYLSLVVIILLSAK
jgi:hypothetical protein